jgi:hypothetical protein
LYVIGKLENVILLSRDEIFIEQNCF